MAAILDFFKGTTRNPLKIDTELSTFSVANDFVIWTDGTIDTKNNESQDTLTELLKVVKNVKGFRKPEQCIEWLEENPEKKAFVICSGSLGQELVPRIHDKSTPDTIYIFCGCKEQHEEWACLRDTYNPGSTDDDDNQGSIEINQEQHENCLHRYSNPDDVSTPDSTIISDPDKKSYRYSASPIDGRPKPSLSQSSVCDTEPDSKKSDYDPVKISVPVRLASNDSDSSSKPISDDKITPSNHIHEDKFPSISIKSVPLTSSPFAKKIPEQQEQIEESFTKARRFTINFPDGRSQAFFWRGEKICEQFKKIFDDNTYDLNNLVVVDNKQIFIDFINNNRLPHRLVPQYDIIQRDLLISIHFYYKNNTFKYLIKPNCEIADIIDHFIGENNIRSTSPDAYLCFFDKLGKIIQAGKMNEILKVNDSSLPFHVTVEEMTSSTSELCDLTIQLSKAEDTKALFYPYTEWRKINLWLKTHMPILDPSIGEYVYWHRHQKSVIYENQTISSTIMEITPTIIDCISPNALINVILSYDTSRETILTLKSLPLTDLLNNETLLKPLKFENSLRDHVLVLEDRNNQVISEDSMQQSVGSYLVSDDESIRFRICLLIEISTYDKALEIQMQISNRNITIGDLLQFPQLKHDSYKYLASSKTQQVISNNEKLSNLDERKLIFVRESETCFVSIETSNESHSMTATAENVVHQQLLVYATLDTVYKTNSIDDEYQHLLCANDFVPSMVTKLSTLQENSTIRFTLINGNLPVAVQVSTILNDEEYSIEFHCKHEITIERLRQIACKLLNVKNEFYQLTIDDVILDDNEMSLDAIDPDSTNIQLHLVCKAVMNSLITYENKTITLPCNKETLVSSVLDQACSSFCITREETCVYTLYALDADQTQIDSAMTVNDICGLFPEKQTKIPLLMKKNRVLKKH
ncbi:unnamed protein product [Rotaria magnacalcarata]|uniref:Uncharacterized protein n=1 Tax=Rotaria magnacalcarata TaxID=392030 RepID=A0A816Z992_9BILA|nr:unnamed protein product [Rotaria magnacalcarata]